MDQIKRLLKTAADRYNHSQPHGEQIHALIAAAHRKLLTESRFIFYGHFNGRPAVAYNVFDLNGVPSRPIRPDIYLYDSETFSAKVRAFGKSLRDGPRNWTPREVGTANEVVYTSVMAVACCFDLWQRGSRKTPGTVFEILMAALLQEMWPRHSFSKHIPLTALLNDADVAAASQEEEDVEPAEDDVKAGEKEGPGSVSTDLVIKLRQDSDTGLVIPLKITTRERIVQPFAHQRILDSAFGEGTYRSLLVCISETQLDVKTKSVKQVCVPGTVKLFQKYLAPISGLYYCDLPQRYAAPDMQRVLNVRTVGEFFLDADQLLGL